mmetsp:Transcript_28383/g.41938  ORF Transcript_28383/g.41938 Transcript_28383/m.41938 type:complete len:642 (-) Transcript_28383:70-1995(-)|eukprot:CAMPEP_0194218238 /NCGR_PEP_ID=MMETSP0156-20130528/23309_1 /TAXON_ID=33649 /ORGANISM="Thalassionema nitzschioides, Strain L26-B" /LENGTH=641 /DNA_ID=CAMNT_0038947521 /DNA_START=23 /DNA_END=1948 /DNA_ORIENTATION=-
MGVRGAWSVVSNDPNRFGEPWSCSDKSVVWIDGPSLVYYLALQPKYESVENFGRHLNQIGQASPAEVYKRTVNFLTVVSNIANEVHIVMDGVCESSKTTTQVNRMKSTAQKAKEIIRSSNIPLNCHVISILAEWSMVEAIDKIRDSIPNLHLHRPLRMEAETFIDAFLAKNHQDAVIMSDDTDCLIYKHCPGFIPFKSLQFARVCGEVNTLAGFQYLRSKFCRALFADEEDYHLLSILAALAGCDYNAEVLESAQAVLIKSDIAGMRVKHQNTPTAASTFQAVVRYIRHFKIMYGDSWVESIVSSFGLDGVMDALDVVHQTYFSTRNPVFITNCRTVEIQRLFEDRTLYCRPLLESFSSPQDEPTPSRLQRRPKKRIRGKRKKRKVGKHARGRQDKLDNQETRDSPPSVECVDLVHACPCKTIEETKEYLRKESIWSLLPFKCYRRQLYGVLNTMKWMNCCDYVTEWRRIDHRSEVKYQEFLVPISSIQPDECNEVKLESLISNNCIYSSSSLLPGKIKWLFLLLMSSPDTIRSMSTNSTSALDFSIVSLLTVAYYHAKLHEEVALACRSNGTMRSLNHLYKMDMVVAAWIWGILRTIDVSDLPDEFFQSPKIASSGVHERWLSDLKNSIVGSNDYSYTKS